MTTSEPAVPARHDPPPLRPVPHEVLAMWPERTFLENIAALPDGDLVISVHSERRLLRCTPRGEHRPLATLPVPTMGLVVDGERVFVVAGEPGGGPGQLFEVGLDGRVQERLTLAGTAFLNGFTPGHAGRAYTVDSVRGQLIAVDLRTFTAEVVLADAALAKCSPEPMVPGANGLKADDTSLWITNTDRATVLRAELRADGTVGAPRVVAEHLRGDDLALDVDGNAYITTHIENTLVRLRPDGERHALAGPEEGMAGSTSCAFGTAPADATSLFVLTTGGVILPYRGVPQPAKLVRLAVGVAGRPVTFLP
jgi:sugar lactone lactonase YvrE